MDLLADYLWPGDSTGTIMSSMSPAIPPQDWDGDLADHQERTLPSPPTDFMLFLGDFVYADVPYYFGDNLETYRRLYRRSYQSPSFRRVYERLRGFQVFPCPLLLIQNPAIFFTYDDHEFVNNYAGSSRDSGPYLNGSRAFLEYNAQTNFDSPDRNQLYYEFSYSADAAFFVMDTRRHRSTPEVEAADRSMLGAQQLGTFLRWLSKVRPELMKNLSTSLITQVNSTSTFKFIITSVPFTSLWTHDAAVDSWAAYSVEKASILDAIATVPNVIILSGDRHEFALVELNHPSPTSHRVLEISTSPLSMYVNAYVHWNTHNQRFRFYIPLVRTLLPSSTGRFSRKSLRSTVQENGDEAVVEFVEQIPHERVLKYLPIGNYKWYVFNLHKERDSSSHYYTQRSTIEVDSSNPESPIARLEVVIDGEVSYRHTIKGSSIPRSTTEVGTFVPLLRDMFLKMGIKPSTWF